MPASRYKPRAYKRAKFVYRLHLERQLSRMLVRIVFLFVCYRVCFAATCTYQNEVHRDGDTVNTAEPCLNCTCISGVLLCYLRVCTTVLPSPSNCVAEKLPGDCCPHTVCNAKETLPKSTNNETADLEVQLKSITNNVVRTTEPKPTIPTDLFTTAALYQQTNMVITSTSSLSYNDIEGGCYLDGSLYAEGSAMMSPSFCHYCYCIRGKQVCLQPKCHLTIQGCKARYLSEFTCCPTHYDCEDAEGNSTETTSSLNVEGTTTLTVEPEGCVVDGFTYSVGDAMPSIGECKTCYCSRDGVKCSPLQCSPVMDGCIPIIPEGHCCPVQYTCNFTQYPSKNPLVDATWGVGEIQEINTQSEVNFPTTESFRTLGPITTTSPFLTTTTPPEDHSSWEKAAEKKGEILLSQDEFLSTEPSETTEFITTPVPHTDTTQQHDSTTTVADKNDDVTITEQPSTVDSIIYHLFITQRAGTTESLLEPTTTTAMEDVANTRSANEDASSRTEGNSTTTESSRAVEKDAQTELSFSESSTEGKRLRLEDPTRHLPPFLFLGTRLAVRPVPLGGPTRLPFRQPSQKPQRTKPVPVKGACAIDGRIFMNGELIVRADPCEVCRCISGREMCQLQKCLPPPSPDCKSERSPGFCCPHYICINPPPFDVPAQPPRHETPISPSEGPGEPFRSSIRFPTEHHPSENIPAGQEIHGGIHVVNKPPIRIPEEHKIQNSVPVGHKTPDINPWVPTTPSPKVADKEHRTPYNTPQKQPEVTSSESVTVTVASEQKTVPSLSAGAVSVVDHSTANKISSNTPAVPQTAYTTTTSEALVTTIDTPSKVIGTSGLSFLDHLLSLMNSSTSSATQRPISQHAVPGSLVGNSWGVLRVSGCNVYGRYYILHERIPQLSTECKICICDTTGVNCSSIC